MSNPLARPVPAALLVLGLCIGVPAHADLYGDTVRVDYSETLGGTELSMWLPAGIAWDRTTATIGDGIEFTGTAADHYGQQWTISLDFTHSGLVFGLAESTKADQFYSVLGSTTNLFNFDFTFDNSVIDPSALSITAPSSPSAYVHLGEPVQPSYPNLKAFENLSGNEQSLHVAFNGLWVIHPTAPVPEPETWALLLAGLGLIGSISRRRARHARAAT